MDQQYVYRNRAVAFLDVLGFRQKLIEFEAEARDNQIIAPAHNDPENVLHGKFVSKKANEFINTFKNSIGQLDKDKYKYYLFSDNICITSITDTGLSINS